MNQLSKTIIAGFIGLSFIVIQGCGDDETAARGVPCEPGLNECSEGEVCSEDGMGETVCQTEDGFRHLGGEPSGMAPMPLDPIVATNDANSGDDSDVSADDGTSTSQNGEAGDDQSGGPDW